MNQQEIERLQGQLAVNTVVWRSNHIWELMAIVDNHAKFTDGSDIPLSDCRLDEFSILEPIP